MMIEKKNMYIILKKKDVEKYLSLTDLDNLEDILRKISDGRISENKNPYNTYYVCNTDEPYADTVYKAIIEGENNKNN